jgi:hypothetical protein
MHPDEDLVIGCDTGCDEALLDLPALITDPGHIAREFPAVPACRLKPDIDTGLEPALGLLLPIT